MRFAVVVLDAAVWLGLVWIGFAVHQHFKLPHWLLPAFVIPATIQLWCRIGTTVAELVAVLFFLAGASVFFLLGERWPDVTPGLPDLLAYAICAGASLAGFRTWQPVGFPDDGDHA